MAPESRDEVRQRIDSLYDQAEYDTGTFNATRAMAAQRRSRGVPLAKQRGRRPDPGLDEVARQWFDAARAKLGPTVPAALPSDRLPDRTAGSAGNWDRSGADALAPGERQALEPGPSARAPQALERGTGSRAVAELTSGRPTQGLPPGRAVAELTGQRTPAEPSRAQAVGEPTGGLPTGEPAGRRTAGELTGGPTGGYLTGGLPVGNLTGGPTTGNLTGELPVGNLTGGPTTGNLTGELPVGNLTGELPVGEPAAGWGSGGLAGGRALEPSSVDPVGGSAATALLPVTAALPAPPTPPAPANPVREPRTLPGAVPGRPSPGVHKTENRRKLKAAAEQLTRYAANIAVPAAAVQPAPAETDQTTWTAPARTAWTTPVQADRTAWTTPVQADRTAWTAAARTAPAPTPWTAPAQAAPAPTPWTAGITEQPAQPVESVQPAVSDTGALPVVTAPGTPLTETGSRALRAAKAIAFARAQVGKPCVWGATGPDSYDCSSLTQAAWKAAGVTLPRAAHEQALAGAPVVPAGLEPGDLVLFFDDDRHVGLHVGDGMMVHAPGPGSTIREESIYGAGEAAIHRIVRPA